MFSLLEDPNIWQSDFLPFETGAADEETKQEDGAAEKYCEDILFTDATVL